MSSAEVGNLINKDEHRITKNENRFNDSKPIQERFAITLWFLGTVEINET